MVEHNFLALKVPVRGLKANLPEHTAEEREKLDGQLNFLHQLISAERVVKGSQRSIGIYESGKNRVRLTQKRNKWQTMGHSDAGEWYLAAHEALYMIEMNYLEVSFGGVVVSVEQAYSLFVGRIGCLSLEDYFVFATLTRIGYTVVRYDKQADENLRQRDEEEHKLDAESEAVWTNLFSLLPSRCGTQSSSKDGIYVKISASMREINSRTIQATSPEVDKLSSDGWPTKFKRKAKATGHSRAKRQKVQPSHYLDRLKYEPEYKTFSEIFSKIEIIEGTHHTEPLDDGQTVPELQFDLYSPNQAVKKSIPNFRVIIRK
jgi:tRNA-splicing endonuclease subunit Sen54